jgi:hypothetical protein
LRKIRDGLAEAWGIDLDSWELRLGMRRQSAEQLFAEGVEVIERDEGIVAGGRLRGLGDGRVHELGRGRLEGWGRRRGTGQVSTVAGHALLEAVDGGGDGNGGAGEGDAVGAGGFAFDEGLNVGEGILEEDEEQFEGSGVEAIDPGVHFIDEGLVVVVGAAAGAGLVTGTELLSRFGNAAARAAAGVGMGAFGTHGRFPPGRS